MCISICTYVWYVFLECLWLRDDYLFVMVDWQKATPHPVIVAKTDRDDCFNVDSLISQPPPLNRDCNGDPNIEDLNRKGFINHGSPSSSASIEPPPQTPRPWCLQRSPKFLGEVLIFHRGPSEFAVVKILSGYHIIPLW